MVADKDSDQTDESFAKRTDAPLCGERLAKARRARSISVREIAKELHLDELKVRAMEENRFDVLGAPVFAKGHLRKYAELVGVAMDELLGDYYQLNRSAGAPPVVGPRRKVARDLSVGPWAAGLAAVLVLGAAAGWWFSRPPSPPASVQPDRTAPLEADRPNGPEAAPDEAAAGVEPGTAPLDAVAGTDEAAGPRADVVEPAPQRQAGAEPAAGAPEEDESPAGSSIQLVLSYSGDCWTEVTDAMGRRLFFNLGSEGRTVTLSGVEPLGVLLGDSANVTLRVNDRDYAIPAESRRGKTARLTIYGE